MMGQGSRAGVEVEEFSCPRFAPGKQSHFRGNAIVLIDWLARQSLSC